MADVATTDSGPAEDQAAMDDPANARPFAGWVRGDHLGIDIPAEPADLKAGGPDFLTAAFRASGALSSGNAVAGITRFEELAVGGTGRKLILSVVYDQPDDALPTELFVKFSRNSDDRVRDRLRNHMREEIALGLASRQPGFPVRVPLCMFADFQAETGTGILITERVLYGEHGVEPCHVKCQDYNLDNPVDHYRTLAGALARLSGSFKGGAMSGDVLRFFPAGSANIFENYRIAGQLDRIQTCLDRIEEFDREFPQLIYHADDAAGFFGRMRGDIVSIVENAEQIENYLHSDDRFVSLCHFNANIDNAWFWTDDAGELHCGLLDWGMVGQMHVGLALWGSLSGAEAGIWNDHLDGLIAEFVREYRACGGPDLDPQLLKQHVHLFAICMALSSLMNAPAFVRNEIPELRSDATRFDREFDVHENARVQLHILNNFLRIWEKFDLAWLKREVIGNNEKGRA